MLYTLPIHPITGTVPGKLDPNQPSRVLHSPGSILSFAIYSPFAARNPASPANSLDPVPLREELCRNKRIVIETTSTGDSFWRWVPRAHLQEGVTDEGVWPREVRYCGERVVLSLDQWDIHKLDPALECRILRPPAVPEIDIKKSQSHVPPPQVQNQTDPTSPGPVNEIPEAPRTPVMANSRECAPAVTPSKRPRNRPGSSSGGSSESLQTPPHKRPRAATVEDGSGDESDDTMDLADASYAPSSNADCDPSSSHSGPPFDFTRKQTDDTEPSLKRKMSPELRHPDDEPIMRPHRPHRNEKLFKRSRTASPDQLQHEHRKYSLKQKRFAHARVRRYQQRKDERSQALEQQFMQTLIIDEPEYRKTNPHRGGEDEPTADAHPEVPDTFTYSSTSFRASEPPEDTANSQEYHDARHASGSTHHSYEQPSSEEAARLALLEESRRKLQELERDRPLWEEARLRREAEERLKAEQEAAKRAQHQAKREAETRRTRQSVRQEEADTARKEAARRQYIEMQKRCTPKSRHVSVWTIRMALKHYLKMSEQFDAAKFGKVGERPDFESIPWPISVKPGQMTLEDVSWEGVESFFKLVRAEVPIDEYKSIVLKSHRRYHPDKWRSRGVLAAVTDEVEKYCLETAAQAVAQALTPIWKDASESN